MCFVSAAVPADPEQHLGGAQLHHRVPRPHRPALQLHAPAGAAASPGTHGRETLDTVDIYVDIVDIYVDTVDIYVDIVDISDGWGGADT